MHRVLQAGERTVAKIPFPFYDTSLLCRALVGKLYLQRVATRRVGGREQWFGKCVYRYISLFYNGVGLAGGLCHQSYRVFAGVEVRCGGVLQVGDGAIAQIPFPTGWIPGTLVVEAHVKRGAATGGTCIEVRMKLGLGCLL